MTDEDENIIDKVYRSNWKPTDLNYIDDYKDMKQVAVILLEIDKDNVPRVVFQES